ncbi:MAG TPA: phenylalanine--tRNA ligase subunit alpha [Candidatus Limnocylindria bacterium]|nr:phenylalanine--tRNA ligase subunit alpha [Candidatus Limnocylindria bacterium]
MEGVMEIQARVASLLEQARAALTGVSDTQALDALRVSLLGKKGDLTALLRGMGALDPAQRPLAGQLINQARGEIEALLDAREAELKARERAAKLAQEAIDVTLPTALPRVGTPHPLTLVQREVTQCFIGMGFEVVEGPEIESDHYNFELLNIPENHPARDAQDTFYIDEKTVLRTHTSPVQARVMLSRKPPIRVICPGRVYRADEVDATHSPVFHQIEGLAVDRDVTMADLRGTLGAFARALYGKDIKTRFRPSFFPFTEPSAEVDLTCVVCRGKGCRVCKGTGWIEVLGAGMVNPKVLEACGIDSSVYSGFAFGMGVERITLLRYGISDMRSLFEGDERFLAQFR